MDPLKQKSPTFLVPRTSSMEDNFSMKQGWGDGFGMIQAHYIYCSLYFYYYYISSASDHQALDPRGWGPLSTHVLIYFYVNLGLFLGLFLSSYSDFSSPCHTRLLKNCCTLLLKGNISGIQKALEIA